MVNSKIMFFDDLNNKKLVLPKKPLINWLEKIIEVRQVTKVGKGQKRISFRVIVIIGDSAGQVGIGIGKGTDLLNAKLKSILNAQTHLMTISLTSSKTISSVLFGKFKKSLVILKPVANGRGIRAGNTIRTIAELAGIKNISAKQLGSNNILNNAFATFNAFGYLA
jgi:small subunit ribosomal protein S5